MLANFRFNEFQKQIKTRNYSEPFIFRAKQRDKNKSHFRTKLNYISCYCNSYPHNKNNALHALANILKVEIRYTPTR